MKNLKTLAAVAALSASFVGGGAAFAQTTTTTTTSCRPTDPCYDVLPSLSSVTTQAFDGNATSRLDLVVDNALNGVNAASTAVANSLKLEGKELDQLSAKQTLTRGDVVAELNATLPKVTGAVDLAATAIGNTVSANVDVVGVININQNVARDPTAQVNAYLGNIDGTVNIAATAIANNVSVDGDFAVSTISQVATGAPVIAKANVGIVRATGAVDVATTAIGNSISLKGF